MTLSGRSMNEPRLIDDSQESNTCYPGIFSNIKLIT